MHDAIGWIMGGMVILFVIFFILGELQTSKNIKKRKREEAVVLAQQKEEEVKQAAIEDARLDAKERKRVMNPMVAEILLDDD